jgi:hypothetical protein
MSHPQSVSSREQVIDTMIDLTRLSYLHRAIIAGSESMELYLALRRRGFIRATTTAILACEDLACPVRNWHGGDLRQLL